MYALNSQIFQNNVPQAGYFKLNATKLLLIIVRERALGTFHILKGRKVFNIVLFSLRSMGYLSQL